MQRSRRLFWLLPAILLLAFALRTYHLDHFGFWQDEGLTPARAISSLSAILHNHIVIQGTITNDTVPPFYFLITSFTRQLWGDSDFAYRYLSVLMGLLILSLLYQWGRRLFSPTIGILAVGFMTINPLYIWYAQEARMYMLVIFLALATTYVLTRALTRPHLWQWFALYLLLAGLSVYTHYLAIFLIAGQGLIWAWHLWQIGHKWMIGGGLMAGILLAIPLVPYTIPRLFTGAEADYFFVPPWVILQDIIHGFGLGRTLHPEQGLTILIDIVIVLLILLGIWWARGQKRTLLLVYLLSIPAGIILLSPLKPMYQSARHIIIGSPPFFILLALGITALWRKPAPLKWGGLLLALFPLVGAGISLHNLYTDPAYAKDDTRALIQHIEQFAGNNDAILFNDAISLPLAEHYQTRNLPLYALPMYPHGFNDTTLTDLEHLATTYDRVWFIWGLPAQDRDKDEAVYHWLQEHLTLLDSYNAHGKNRVIQVDTYATPHTLTNTTPTNMMWDNLPAITAYHLAPHPRTLWLSLQWQGNPTPPADTYLRLALQDVDGHEWVTNNQPILSKDNTLRPQWWLSLPAGMPPGTYTLYLQPWHQPTGNTLGEWQALDSITIVVATAEMPATTYTPDWCPITFANGMKLTKVSGQGAVKPGHPLPFTLYWENVQPHTRYQLETLAPDGTVLRTDSGTPLPSWSTPAPLIQSQTGLYFPSDTLPDTYRLRWSLFEGDTPIAGKRCYSLSSHNSIEFGEVVVEPWELVTDLSALAEPIRAQFGETIQLYGYTIDSTNPLHITLHWQAQAPPTQSYLVFIHVRDDAGNLVAQSDQIPAQWLRPTNSWRTNEVITDLHTVDTSHLPAGNYSLYAGLYIPDTWERPLVSIAGNPQPDNQIHLTTITLP